MKDSNSCRWRQIPFTCIECPIRQVQMSCVLNNDFGDWKFWDRRKQKWPVIGKQKLQNRGLLMELCRKSCCNPEFIKYILVSAAHSAERCMCPHTDPFPKYTPVIPFAKANGKHDTDDYGYAFEHWFPQYVLRHLNKSPGDDQKPKIFEKITPDWLDDLYELYNEIVGPKPEDQLELYLQELLKRRQDDELNHNQGEDDKNENENYDIDREGRFEQPGEYDEYDENDENYSDKERDDKHDTKKKGRRSTRRSDEREERRRRRLHNPIDIFYFDPLSEAQRQAYKERLPRTLGPRKYKPPPEDRSPDQKAQFRTSTRFESSNLSRLGNYDRIDRNNRNTMRSVNSFFKGGYPYLNPRQLTTFASPTGRQSHFRFQAPIKRQVSHAPPKGKSRNLPETKSQFHSFGYS